ncbi:hypothetical protein [Sodalis glossinidius]|uniref:hypothetical protein n=1 Tax=Sodalis glossinidius TaxID=63612 RepID=UPI0002D7BCAF|nr:hypothetical protein [Sodalis glossinidius]
MSDMDYVLAGAPHEIFLWRDENISSCGVSKGIVCVKSGAGPIGSQAKKITLTAGHSSILIAVVS